MDDNTQPITDDQVTGDQTPAVPADDQPVIEETSEMPATESSTEDALPETSTEFTEEGESFEDPAGDLGQHAL